MRGVEQFQAIHSAIGHTYLRNGLVHPLPGKWNVHSDRWPEVIAARTSQIESVGLELPQVLGHLYGNHSDEMMILRHFTTLIDPLSQIAQIQAHPSTFRGDPYAWVEKVPEQSRDLHDCIMHPLHDWDLKGVARRNPHWYESLIILDRLARESNPEELYRMKLELEYYAVEAISAGKPALFFNVDDAYKNPQRSWKDNPVVAEASALVALPLPDGFAQEYEELRFRLWERLGFLYGGQNGHAPQDMPMIAVVGTGFDVFSQYIGMSLDREEYGFMLAVNHIWKHTKMRKRVHDLMDIHPDPSTLLRVLLKGITLHEYAHEFTERTHMLEDAQTQVLEEFAADITSINSHIEDELMLLQDSIVTMKGKNILNTVIAEILTSCVQEISEAVHDGGIYEGYDVSARMVLNALVRQGVVQIESSGQSLVTDVSEHALASFTAQLMPLFEGLKSKTIQLRNHIGSTQLLPEAEQLVTLVTGKPL